MRQARWTDAGIALQDVPLPPLRSGWVRLRVLANGICGTDLHLYRGELPRNPTETPGHEISGTPLDGPKDLSDGIYAVEPRIWCGSCDPCVTGERQLCSAGQILGLDTHGGLAEFVDVPPASLHRSDASLSPLLVSLAEPLAVAVRGIRLAQLEPDSRVLVLGGGTIGLLSGLLARDRASRVGITVRHPHQAAAANALGLEPVGEDALRDWAKDTGPDVVIETVGGNASTLNDAVRACRPAGRVVVLGLFAGEKPIHALVLMANEITLIGSNSYGTGRRGSEFRAAVEMLPRYQAELKPLQTHQFSLSELGRAFDCAANKQSRAIKVTVQPE